MKKRFAKLEDGGLVFAPKKVLWHNKWVFNPSEKKLRELGYPTFTEFYLKICEN